MVSLADFCLVLVIIPWAWPLILVAFHLIDNKLNRIINWRNHHSFIKYTKIVSNFFTEFHHIEPRWFESQFSFDIPVLFEFLPVSVSEPCFNLRFISARSSRGAHIIILLMVRTIFTRNPIYRSSPGWACKYLYFSRKMAEKNHQKNHQPLALALLLVTLNPRASDPFWGILYWSFAEKTFVKQSLGTMFKILLKICCFTHSSLYPLCFTLPPPPHPKVHWVKILVTKLEVSFLKTNPLLHMQNRTLQTPWPAPFSNTADNSLQSTLFWRTYRPHP